MLQPKGESSIGEFEYVGSWLRNEHGKSFALDPENLPLVKGAVRIRKRGQLPGPLADATPDLWGRKLIAALMMPAKPSSDAVEWLLATGDERVGCLAFSQDADAPELRPGVANVSDLQRLAEAFEKIARGEKADVTSEQIFRAGRSLGGARPKAVVIHEGALWIAKFQRGDDDFDQCAAEHAAMRLATACGISAAETNLMSVGARRIVLVRRFDRGDSPSFHPTGHYLSALSALDLDDTSQEGSYPEIAGFLRRHSAAQVEDRIELFRRMVFNMLAGNRDDHLKNHGFLYRPGIGWHLTPAFDVVPQPDMYPMQAIGLGRSGVYPSLDNCLSMSAEFGLDTKRASSIAGEITKTMRSWRAFFEEAGCDDATISRMTRAFSPSLDSP